MKPKQVKAETERLAALRLRKLARQIPDNAKLVNILLQYDKPFRRDFYNRVKPYLKFEPAALEIINGIQG